MNIKERVLAHLDAGNIDYRLTEHEPIHTIGALDDLALEDKTLIPKNLFLRNGSGKIHYIVTVRQDKTVDLKGLRAAIGSSRLSFGSEERLMKHLGLTKGSVTPLGIINNEDSQVQVILDEDLKEQPYMGVHPCTNDATVWLTFEELVNVIEAKGNPLTVMPIV